MKYYILQNDETRGPYTLGQLKAMRNSGAITTETMHSREGYRHWLPLGVMLHELEPPQSQPHASAPQPSAPYTPPLPRHESGSKRSSRHNKAIGGAMMCISVPGCMACASSGGEHGMIGMFVWMALFFVGTALFIVGRFQE